MNVKRNAIAAAAVVAVAALVATGCGSCRPGPEKRADWVVKKISSKLDLTKEQKAKLDAIKVEVLAKFKEERATHRKMGSEAIALVKSDKLDEAAVNRLLDTRETSMKRLRPYIVDKIVEFHAMLTPEQRAKLASLMEEHHARWKE